MNVVFKIDLDVVFILLLLYITGVAYRRLDRRETCNRSFLTITVMTIIQMLTDVIWTLVDRVNVPWLIPISVGVNIISFALCPVMVYLWVVFVYVWIFKEQLHKLHRWLLQIPILINAVTVSLSPFFGFIFSVDSMNVYRRGPYFFTYVIIVFFYLITSLSIIIFNIKKMLNREYITLILFFIVPCTGGVLQALNFGLYLIWSCSAFSMAMVYIFLQQKMMQIDSLTGAWTKATFENYIVRKAEHQAEGHSLGLIFLDMNHFKKINDSCGHMEGDLALYTTVSLIKKSLPENGIVAIFGGDEFVILVENTTEENLHLLETAVEKQFDIYNSTSGKPYTLTFSSSSGVFITGGTSIWECLNCLDYLMYQNKGNRRSIVSFK
jgi:diguanylate cyclase (GGDEF)-like protein